MDASRQLSQLGKRLHQLIACGVEQAPRSDSVLVDGRVRSMRSASESGHKLLLGSVMEVSLQAAALGIAGGDDASSREAASSWRRAAALAKPQRNQLGELLDARPAESGVSGASRVVEDDDGAPQLPSDADRGRHRRRSMPRPRITAANSPATFE